MPPASKARIHAHFQELVQALATQAAALAKAAQGDGQRQWQTPPQHGWSGDVFDIPGMDQAFDRSEINSNFAEVCDSADAPGTVGDVASLKLQADYTAMVERAYRARVASPARCLAHAAARRAGHGHAAGIFTGGVLRYAQDLLRAGQT